MTPAEFRAALDRLSLTQRGFARRVGISERNVRRMCDIGDEGPLPPWIDHIIALEEGRLTRRCDELRAAKAA